MSRRICIACLAGVLASAAPAVAGVNYTSSETQYQGVLPEATATGAPGGGTGPGANGGATGAGGNGANGTTNAGNGAGAGSSTPGTAPGAKGSGGSSAGASAASADSATRPFSGGDILLAVLAAAGLLALGIVLRRSTRREPASP